MKKKVLRFFVLCFLTVMSANAQSEKIIATECAFIQGGETSLEALGVTKPDALLVFNSKGNTKYSRITFMKFKLPQGFESAKSVEFDIRIKVFKDKVFPDSKFDLDIQGVPNSKWSSQSITFNNAPKLGNVLGSAQLNQSIDDKTFEWVKIKLDVDGINELIKDSKKRTISLALANNISVST
ncbi:CBM96 family carbohydrate-binding protein, partial [Flavobacterium gilvum]